MESQKDLVKEWTKMELNSSYGLLISLIHPKYEENKAHKITEEGKKYLMIIQETIKNVI